jgi:hypothetical protein
VLWIIGGAIYAWQHQAHEAASFAAAAVDLCNQSGDERADCSKTFTVNYNMLMEFAWLEVLLLAFVPVILAWIVTCTPETPPV